MTKSIKEKMTQLHLLHRYHTRLRKKRLALLRKQERDILKEYKKSLKHAFLEHESESESQKQNLSAPSSSR